MIGLTLDANIYISAMRYGGKPMALVEMGLEGEVDIAISQPIIDETLRVLREKFNTPETDLRVAEATMKACARMVTPETGLNVVKDDQSDNKIVECAVAARSEYIVTGDAHLLRIREYEGIKIMRVSDFLRLLEPGRGR